MVNEAFRGLLALGNWGRGLVKWSFLASTF